MVDNCYGEFVEDQEPSDVGADMVVGSLIKNPGGGLAPDVYKRQTMDWKYCFAVFLTGACLSLEESVFCFSISREEFLAFRNLCGVRLFAV